MFFLKLEEQEEEVILAIEVEEEAGVFSNYPCNRM